MSFIVPSPSDLIARYQDLLRPEDPAFGNGVADWIISSEYQDDPQSENGGGPIWGCMCSPSRLPEVLKLQPEDIAAKRAHIILRRPKTIADIAELHRTVLHELGHVLVAPMQSENREAEENAMHSLDHFFSKLSPEQSAVLARSFQNPMARAYRAKEKAMPDPIEDKKEPDKQAPAMQEGAPRDIAAIEADILKTRLAGGDVAALLDEWLAAKMAATANDGPASTPEPPMAPPTMGMKPEDAYARAKRESDKQAAEALAKSIPGLDDKQRAYLRAKCNNIADVEAALEIMPRTTSQNEPARMGMQTNPKTDPKATMKPMARAMATAAENPMLRKLSGIGTLDNDGLHYEPQAGVLFYVDGTEQLNHQRAKLDARREERRGAA